MTSLQLLICSILMPLLGGLVTYLGSSRLAGWFSLMGMMVGVICLSMLFPIVLENPLIVRFEWFTDFELGLNLDRMAIILMALVFLISLLVHAFSLFYMSEDKGIGRYFAFLGFFTSSMLGLIAADHLLLVFIFWELVGFSSFLLIGFWYRDPVRANSSREAFMVNRVADAALLIGMILMITALDQSFLSELTTMAPTFLVNLAGSLLLVGALGKSAQFPFFGWLSKAMAGPTPVSALIHAATMVAAGIYLLVRSVPFLSPAVLSAAAIIGGVTALMAALSALRQHDIKKVLAYSTISQLGYMTLGIGVGAYQAALFHLWTHAFFKAGLFLGAGVVIHYLQAIAPSGEHVNGQDMRQMGGLKKILPFTHWIFIVCGLALSGIPFFSGFLSKEGILLGALTEATESMTLLAMSTAALAFLTALITPIYIARQILLVFYRKPERSFPYIDSVEPLLTVKLPLIVLAMGSIWLFSALNPFDASNGWLTTFLFSTDIIAIPSDGAIAQTITLVLSIVLALTGLVLAFWWFHPGTRYSTHYSLVLEPDSGWKKILYEGWGLETAYAFTAKMYGGLCSRVYQLERKWIDPVINGIGVGFVVAAKALAILDREVVDGLVNFVAWIGKIMGRLFTGFQPGKIQNQILILLIILAGLFLWLQL